MIKMTRSLEVFLSRNYPKQFVTISFGHLEDFTDEMKDEYIEWVMTDEGKEYLEGGKHYEREEDDKGRSD